MGRQVMAEWQPENAEVIRISDKDKLVRLAESAARGGREELVALCEAITRDVLFRVMRWIPNHMDAEDVSQNVLIRICESIHSLKNTEAFGGWLNTIIKNEINRHYSRNPQRGTLVSIDDYFDAAVPETLIEEDVESLPSEYVIREEERKVIMSMVDKLPERQLEAVLLHYFEGMSTTQTAEAMGVTQPAVSRYLYLAKKKVKNEIDRHIDKTKTMQNFSYMAIGPLMIQAMHEEAAVLHGMSRVFVESIVDAGIAKSHALNVVRRRNILNIRDLAKGFTLTMSAVAVVFSTWVSSQFIGTTEPIDTKGEIIFSDRNMNPVTVNPVHFEAWARNDRGELSVLRWSITGAGVEGVLYSGEGVNAEAALTELTENCYVGEYTLYLSLKDDAGSTYTMQKKFWIANESVIS